jgi:hypothetical protein
MPRTDEQGNVEFHPIELPNDFESAADPENPFVRKQFESETTTRACKICGKRFTLGVPYDKDDPGHDLCEDCIIEQKTPQNYSETTIQIDQTMIDSFPTAYQEEYHEKDQSEEEE